MRLRLSLLLAIAGTSLLAAAAAPARPVAHQQPAATFCQQGYYKNVDGKCVHSPSSNPARATARCRDGSYSYSQHASGTCSHHGGVGRWIHHP
jgi:hypothetical protein